MHRGLENSVFKRCRSVLVIVVLLAASCGSSATDQSDSSAVQAAPAAAEPAAESSADQSSADESSADQAASAATSEPSMSEALQSPLAEALGFDPDDRTAVNNAYLRSAENLVRKCMADAGFEYVPQDIGFAPSFEERVELEASLSVEEFTKQYGYGLATLFELNFQGEGVMNFVEQLLGPPPTVERSAAEQEAYDLVLRGQSIQGLSAEEAQDQAVANNGLAEPGSCRRIGYDQAENPQGETWDGLQSLLGDEYRAMNDRIESDSRIRDARRDWQRCIGEAGYSFEAAEDIRRGIETTLDDLAARFIDSPEAGAIFAKAILAGLANMDGPDRFDFLESAGALQGFSMVPDLQVELDAVIDYELEIANRSFECTDRQLVIQVRNEAEQAFVEAYADQLALLVNGDG